MRTVPTFVLFGGVAIALSAAAFAQDGGKIAHRPNQDDSSELKRLSLTDLRVARDAESSRSGADAGGGRQNTNYPPGTLVSVRDELENFPVDTSFGGAGVNAPPTSFTGPPGFQWPLNNLRGQSSVNFVRLVDLSGAPVTGPNGVTNGSKALRILTGTAQPANGFFTGANLRFGGGSPGEPTLPLEPIPGVNARISAEHWVSSIDTLYTFEPVSVFAGYITGRMLWGGTCVNDTPNECHEIGLPTGTIDHFLVLAPGLGYLPSMLFFPATYCTDTNGSPIVGCTPHPGFQVGHYVPPPIQNWTRIAGETTADGYFEIKLDLLDGTPEATIWRHHLLTSNLIDRVGWNASFEAQGEFMLVDNIEASGALYQPPKPPPLTCPYVDELEWLNPGQVLGQTQRWFPAITSGLTVVDDGMGNRFLRQVNDVLSSNEFREEFRTLLPNSFALPGDPWSVCFDAATTLGDFQGPHVTARAFSIGSEATAGLGLGGAARVFLGVTDPDTGLADSTIYVQINPWYDPIDYSWSDPDNNPAVVGVDVATTGAQWPADGQFRTLCVTVANDNLMTVSLDGVDIYTGIAFSNGASVLRAESENNWLGRGARLDLDNIDFDCDPLPIVSLDALVSPYREDFDWGVDNVPPERHIDDAGNTPDASTRFVNNSDVVMRDGAVEMGRVPRNYVYYVMEDPLRDYGGIFEIFTARTPPIVVDPATGWRVEMTLTLSDFLTSRGFSPAQFADVGNVFELAGYLWISAVDQRVYLFAHPDNATPDDDLITVDTGFTLSALGVTPGAPFSARAEFNRLTGLIDWSINSIALGSTNPIVGTDDQGSPRVHQNLDNVFFWGGDDDTAPGTPPYSTMTLDDLRARALVDCLEANDDGVIDFADLNIVLSNFGSVGFDLPGDVNRDGRVDFLDLNYVLGAFGAGCR